MEIINPFLQGPFEPLKNEYKIESAHVIGKIPAELKGTLYRTGSNVEYMMEDPNRFHWFDGDGMVHAFRLNDGEASYICRWVETEGLKVERKSGKQLYNGIYGRSEKPQIELPSDAPEIKTVAGINVIRLGERLLTMHEVENHYWELDPITLETIGKFDFNGGIKGMLTAHPHFDHLANEWLFCAFDNEARIFTSFTTDPDGNVISKYETRLGFSPWNHDLIFTENYFIYFFGMISFRPLSPDRIPQGKSALFIDPDTGLDAKMLFVNRKNGEAQWMEPENSPYILGHFMNAYEENGEIIVDASITPLSGKLSTFNPEDYYPFPLVPGPSAFKGPELWRLSFSLETGEIETQRIGDFNAEFCRLNEKMMGTKIRYGYVTTIHNLGPETRGFNSIAKHDYETGETQFQHLAYGYDMVPGEVIYVPHPQSESEDHGWIMNIWYDPRRNTSQMIIFDAQNFDGEPLARITLDHRIPLGFHGNWIEDKA